MGLHFISCSKKFRPAGIGQTCGFWARQQGLPSSLHEGTKMASSDIGEDGLMAHAAFDGELHGVRAAVHVLATFIGSRHLSPFLMVPALASIVQV